MVTLQFGMTMIPLVRQSSEVVLGVLTGPTALATLVLLLLLLKPENSMPSTGWPTVPVTSRASSTLVVLIMALVTTSVLELSRQFPNVIVSLAKVPQSETMIGTLVLLTGSATSMLMTSVSMKKVMTIEMLRPIISYVLSVSAVRNMMRPKIRRLVKAKCPLSWLLSPV